MATLKSKLVKNLEKKLPFEVKEEALREIANNILARAKEIREGLKTDPVATVKNYKTLLDMPSLVAVKKTKAKTAKKTTKAMPKKALKKAKTAKASGKSSKGAIH